MENPCAGPHAHQSNNSVTVLWHQKIYYIGLLNWDDVEQSKIESQRSDLMKLLHYYSVWWWWWWYKHTSTKYEGLLTGQSSMLKSFYFFHHKQKWRRNCTRRCIFLHSRWVYMKSEVVAVTEYSPAYRTIGARCKQHYVN